MSCWRCHEKVGGPVCASCGAVQPPPAQPDFFDALGLPRRWSLDQKQVDSAWRDRSRLVHPDRFAGKSAVERRMSLQWTATINSARRALRDPIQRGWYLATGAARPPEDGNAALDPDFLEQVFELQLEAGDDPQGVSAQAQALKSAVMTELEQHFAAWEADDDADLDRAAVTELLARTKYLENLITP